MASGRVRLGIPHRERVLRVQGSEWSCGNPNPILPCGHGLNVSLAFDAPNPAGSKNRSPIPEVTEFDGCASMSVGQSALVYDTCTVIHDALLAETNRGPLIGCRDAMRSNSLSFAGTCWSHDIAQVYQAYARDSEIVDFKGKL